jgi:hypothetical protein
MLARATPAELARIPRIRTEFRPGRPLAFELQRRDTQLGVLSRLSHVHDLAHDPAQARALGALGDERLIRLAQPRSALRRSAGSTLSEFMIPMITLSAVSVCSRAATAIGTQP